MLSARLDLHAQQLVVALGNQIDVRAVSERNPDDIALGQQPLRRGALAHVALLAR
jgi:hypothetical protein